MAGRRPVAGLVTWLACSVAVCLATPVAAQSSTCPTRTGENATVLIPADVLTTGVILEEGDVVRAYGAADGGCIGDAVWPSGGGVALTLWGDDTETPVRDGALPGEAFVLRAMHGEEGVSVEVTIEAVLSAPAGTGAEYHPGAIYIVSELGVHGPPAPEVTVALAAKDAPVVIAAEGGEIPYTFAVTNPTSYPQTVDAWVRAVRPDGQTTRVLLGPVTVSLTAGATASRQLVQVAGERVRAGEWVYTGYVGTFPDAPTDSSSITVTKEGEGTVRRMDVSAGWLEVVYGQASEQAGQAVRTGDVWGDDARDASSEADLPQAHLLHGPRPNPSSSYAALAFELAEAGQVRLTVYDVLGREVAVLADGLFDAGRYESVLEGQRLPSGSYFARMHVSGAAAPFAQTRRITLVR